MADNKTIVAFHVGRGGNFNNGGHVTFNPYVKSLGECIKDGDFWNNEDENGHPLPDEKWTLTDGGGMVLLEGRDEMESDTGRIERDGIYDTDIVKYIEDCTDEELEAIWKEYERGEWMTDEVKDHITDWKGYKRITSVKKYPTNFEVFFSDGTSSFESVEFMERKDVDDDWVKDTISEMGADPVSIKEFADGIILYYEWTLG